MTDKTTLSIRAREAPDRARATIEPDPLHEFVATLCTAAEALYNTAAAGFTPEQIALVRRTRDAGGALAVRIQTRPTWHVECVVEDLDGRTTTLFDFQRVAPD